MANGVDLQPPLPAPPDEAPAPRRRTRRTTT
jgi:hypothetical protein